LNEENFPVLKLKKQVVLDPHSVQIIISHDEMKNRIQKYTERKREQNNLNNIQDFTNRKITSLDFCDSGTEDTCARVDAILLKSKDSKSHLKGKIIQHIE